MAIATSTAAAISAAVALAGAAVGTVSSIQQAERTSLFNTSKISATGIYQGKSLGVFQFLLSKISKIQQIGSLTKTLRKKQ